MKTLEYAKMTLRTRQATKQEMPSHWLTAEEKKENSNYSFKVTIEPIKKETRKAKAFQELLDFKPIKGNLKPAVEIIRELREHA